MEIIRRSDYACRILRAAYRANGDYLSISTISEEEKIPYAFARNIQHVLLQIGYVKTRRGARGGLALSIDPAKVSMLDLMRALEVNINLAPCAGSPDVCENSDDCGFNRVWCAATGLLERYFASLSLKDVIEGKVDVPVTDFGFAAIEAPGASHGEAAGCYGSAVIAAEDLIASENGEG